MLKYTVVVWGILISIQQHHALLILWVILLCKLQLQASNRLSDIWPDNAKPEGIYMVTEKSDTYSRCLTPAKVTHCSVRKYELALLLTVYTSYVLTCMVLRKAILYMEHVLICIMYLCVSTLLICVFYVFCLICMWFYLHLQECKWGYVHILIFFYSLEHNVLFGGGEV